MKKLFFFLFYILSMGLHAQFMVTPDGLRSEFNEDSDSLIIYITNKDAAELYSITYKYLREIGRDIIYMSQYKSLTYKVEDDNFIIMTSSGMEKQVHAKYEVNLKFYNNRIDYKIDLLYMPVNKSRYSLIFKGNQRDGYPIYNNKSKLIRPSEKYSVEKYFNENFMEFKNIIKRKSTLYANKNNDIDQGDSKIILDKDGLARIKKQ